MEEELVRGGSDRGGGSRTAVVIAALVAVLVVTGWYVDHRFATAEKASVQACVEEADRAVDAAYSPVNSMFEYVRPLLFATTRRSMYDLISRSAQGRASQLEPARTACADVRVLWLHRGTAERRDACVARLDHHQDVLAALAEDGAAIEDGRPDLTVEC